MVASKVSMLRWQPGYPVFTIVNIDKVYADLDISEVNIGSVEKGQKCLLLFLLQTKRSLAVLLLMSAPADPDPELSLSG